MRPQYPLVGLAVGTAQSASLRYTHNSVPSRVLNERLVIISLSCSFRRVVQNTCPPSQDVRRT